MGGCSVEELEVLRKQAEEDSVEMACSCETRNSGRDEAEAFQNWLARYIKKQREFRPHWTNDALCCLELMMLTTRKSRD